MAGNNFGGVLPNSIANLSTNRTQLSISSNYISGTIPQGIENLINLKELYSSLNMLTGSIPESIGKISELERLYIPGNNISGKIPSSLGYMSRLSILSLGRNMLEGSIPPSLGNCTNLQAFYLEQNHLTGAIPEQVIGLSSLSSPLGSKLSDRTTTFTMLDLLFMDDNLFEGTIPLSLQKIKGIQGLDRSRNSLSGRIPSFLGKFRLIEVLDLSYKFEGEVPNEGVFMNDSKFSIVGNDKLCGGIKALQLPACPTQRERKLFPPKATNGFSSANLIGVGRYGPVYKGTLNYGEQIVAVKEFNLQLLGANKSFLDECKALRNIRHRNLVKIITSCSSIDFNGNDFKALVFEFMPNGTLESWLHPTLYEKEDLSSSTLLYSMSLNLIQRLNIAIDVAHALNYLHHHCETTIIHCDLKPSNILLDNELCAHVGDFGLARFLMATEDKSNHTQTSSSIGVRGTIGYVALDNLLCLFLLIYTFIIISLENLLNFEPVARKQMIS
ncbi:receptor kinase-like protein Xa21 [Cornus florida]|uniref:receptor kinase-like protein Xa21 n=1 Tax=Cornus florida TaxID=4283 RepID=UPI002898310E|nr:receptor kinase-like protein Xa21 [Cornus florida]